MTTTAPSPTRLPGWLVGSGVIAVAMGVMNVTTYGFTILAARLLGPDEYGAVAAVMGLLLILNVASLGLQATGARRVAAAPENSRAIERPVLALGTRLALLLGLLSLAASPLVTAFLRLDDWLTAAMIALTVVPLTMMGGQAGILQGGRRWVPLALIYVLAGGGRLACGLLALLWRPDALGAMTGVAVGAWLPLVVGWVALRHRGDEGARGSGVAPSGLASELVHNAHALLAFFALANADVVVARSVFDERQAGLYAGGLILTKAVLFLPQFVVVFAFPSMSRQTDRNRVQLLSLVLVAGIGAVTVVATEVLSPVAVVFVGGAQYADLQGRLWVFAVIGTLLAMIQLMVYDVLARQRRRTVALVWTALAVVTGSAAFVTTTTALLTVVALVQVSLLALLVLARGRART